MFFGGFELIIAIGIVVWLVWRSRQASEEPSSDLQEQQVPPHIEAWLRRWIDAGVLDDTSADSIRSYELNAATRDDATAGGSTTVQAERIRRVPLIAEALGYLGGMLASVGVILLIARYWPDLATGWRILIPALVAIGGVVGGSAIDEAADAAFARLRWFVWLVATAAAGVVGGVIVFDIVDPVADILYRDVHRVVFGAASFVAVLSVVLWRGRPRPVQQLTSIGGVAFAVGSALNEWFDIAPIGAVVWAFGATLICIAIIDIGPLPQVTAVAGIGTAFIGGSMMVDRWMGVAALALVGTSTVCIVAGELVGATPEHEPTMPGRRATSTALIAAGLASLVGTLPMALAHFSDEAGIATGAALWLTGCASEAVTHRLRLRIPLVFHLVAAFGVVVGPAVMCRQSTAVGTLWGLLTAVALLAIGTYPGMVMLSLIGSVGLLVFVPWSISYFFPGEGRVPLLIAVSGALIVAVAVFMARSAGRLKEEFGHSK